jgi:hypothetical protein
VGDREKLNGAVLGHVAESVMGAGDECVRRWVWAGVMLWRFVCVCVLLFCMCMFCIVKKDKYPSAELT